MLALVAALTALITLTSPAPLRAAPGDPQREVGDLGQVGDIHFPFSCDPSLQDEFDRGVALLHSFSYGEARRVFTEIAAKDPECAMAHWGIAMTYYHPVWVPPDSAEMAAGQTAVQAALSAKKTNDYERGYVRAMEAFYKGLDEPDPAAQAVGMSCHGPAIVDSKGRAACFRREMEKVAARYPDDVEANAFYALSLLGTAPPGDPALKNQKEAAAILEKWYAAHRNHPGLVHYLIHAYDYPPLAEQGLPAAQAYAAIAPWVPHALHMPSHIFTRLGMWKETIDSNVASADAARRYETEHHPGAASFEELHSLDYLAYGYLQTAQDAKARQVLERLASIDKTDPPVDFAVAYAFGAIPARYALERRRWDEAATLEARPMPFADAMPFAEGLLAYARAVGTARRGDTAGARAAAERLAQLSAACVNPRLRYFAQQMDYQHEAALGLVALSEGKKDEGLERLRHAADQEDSLGKHPVSPGAILPIRELLGEALLESGKPADALAAFQASLAGSPGRFHAVYGAARAAAAANDLVLARRYFDELVVLAGPGDGARPEVMEARSFLARR